MSAMAQELTEELTRAIESDQLVLPTLPEVALKAREAAEDPDVCAASLSKVVENDAALTARIIKVANSPLLRGSRGVEDLKMAINRLGITFTANLITGLAMEQMFQATSDKVDKIMREVWSHSIEVAGIAHVLCRHYTKLKPEQATLAGLVHEIGVLPILTYAEHNDSLLDEDGFEDIIRAVHPKIGSTILKYWDFPPELIDVPREFLNFERETVGDPDYIDIVMVANLQSHLNEKHPYNEMDWSTVPAFNRLGLSTDVDSQEAEDLSTEMAEAMKLLQ
ncbi:MAG: HDOD domain-containing protein [Pseudomonadales bacterium]|nr:HDOD domain-containing protein [Pseudomonadales bacterium]